VYVTDAGPATHFQSVFACAEKAGYIQEVCEFMYEVANTFVEFYENC
jgi:arginyl-tRNA synthetase